MSGICEGRVAIVTGAGRGIGRGHALELARQGAHVVVNDLGGSVSGDGPTSARPRRWWTRSRRPAAWPWPTPTTWPTSRAPSAWCEQAVDVFGRLDVLVNNAGILRDRMLFNMSEAEWDAVIRVHLKGTFAPSRWAAEHWRDRAKAGETNDARIINTSSTSGLFANPGQTQLRRGQVRHRQHVDHRGQGAGPARRHGQRHRPRRPHPHDREPRRRPGPAPSRPRASGTPGPPTTSPRWSPGWPAPSRPAITGQVFLVGGGRINVAEGWRRGPGVDNGARWDPAELGKVVPDLVSQSAT